MRLFWKRAVVTDCVVGLEPQAAALGRKLVVEQLGAFGKLLEVVGEAVVAHARARVAGLVGFVHLRVYEQAVGAARRDRHGPAGDMRFEVLLVERAATSVVQIAAGSAVLAVGLEVGRSVLPVGPETGCRRAGPLRRCRAIRFPGRN